MLTFGFVFNPFLWKLKPFLDVSICRRCAVFQWLFLLVMIVVSLPSKEVLASIGQTVKDLSPKEVEVLGYEEEEQMH